MKRIVGVHHPDVERELVEQCLQVFYEIRAMSRIRKRPSTSELVDWIAVLQRAGVTSVKLTASPSSARCSRRSRTWWPTPTSSPAGGSFVAERRGGGTRPAQRAKDSTFTWLTMRAPGALVLFCATCS